MGLVGYIFHCMWVGMWVGHLMAGTPQGVTFFVLFSLSLSLDSCDVLSSLSLDYLCLESQLEFHHPFSLFSFYGCPHTVLGRCGRPHHLTYVLSITSPDVLSYVSLWSGRLFLPDTVCGWVSGRDT